MVSLWCRQRSQRPHGLRAPTDDELKRIACAVEMPVEFFYQQDAVYGPGVSEFYHYN